MTGVNRSHFPNDVLVLYRCPPLCIPYKKKENDFFLAFFLANLFLVMSFLSTPLFILAVCVLAPFDLILFYCA